MSRCSAGRRSSDWTVPPDDATLTLGADGEPRSLRGRLIVGGRRPPVLGAAGGRHRSPSRRSYGQTGVVANFACERAHHGVARQWFRADGSVLAWLPLPERRISIVWSAPDALAAELLALPPGALAARVAAAGGARAGRADARSPPRPGFPLSLLRLPTTVAHRLALVGDAAHGVHPLAGPGRQPGIRRRARAGAGPGRARPGRRPRRAGILLARYARRRVEPVLGDAGGHRRPGPAVRAAARPGSSALRNAGMAAVDRIPFLKRALAQPALR